MDVEFGNAGTVDTNLTGWFIGFGDWVKDSGLNLRHVPQDEFNRSLCVKWYHHVKGNPSGEIKQLSEGRTISILVSEPGRFRLEFSTNPEFSSDSVKSFLLQNHGDFVIWGSGIFHRAFGEDASTILTLRWFAG